MLNKVMLIGNLGRDPEVRHLESGAAVAKFSIATNERYKDKSGETKTITEWHDVIMWRGLAELAERLLTKGKLVYIEGKITTRKWQDKEGIERRTTEIIANNFQILEKREGSGGDFRQNFPTSENEPAKSIPSSIGNDSELNPLPETKSTFTDSTPSSTTVDGPDDDLPF